MEKTLLKVLLEKKKINPVDIAREINEKISNNELDEFVESLYARGIIIKPHQQHRSGSLPKYDLIVLTEEGIDIINKILEDS